MKIIIVKQRDDVVTKQVDISQFHTFADLKEQVLSDLIGRQHHLDGYFCVINLNFIMKEDDLITSYAITEDSVIYISRLEHFIEPNQVVMDMFVMTQDKMGLMQLIVEGSTTLEQITGQTNNERIRIWTVTGDLLSSNTVVTDLETVRGHLKLIVSWSDGDEHLSFEDCCECHDRYFMNEFWWIFLWNKILDANNFFEAEDWVAGLKGLRLILKLFVARDERFQQPLSYLPPNLLNSKILVCKSISLSVIQLFRNHLESRGRLGYEFPLFNTYEYLHVTLYFAILDYLDARQSWDSIDIDNDVTLADLIETAMDYWTINEKSWMDRMRLLWDGFLMRRRSDNELMYMWSSGVTSDGLINVKVKASELMNSRLPKSVETILHAKKFIGRILGLPIQDILLINSVLSKEPRNEEVLDRDKIIRPNNVPQYFFEIILKMDNIDALKLLGTGAFGQVFLYQNRASREQFVLKKQTREAEDLYRDISVHSRFANCSNVAKCTGLYGDGQMIYLATEYFPGGSLTSLVKKFKDLSEEMTAHIATQLLVQLEEIHSKKVIHQDIKCDNVVLDGQLNAKFIDFGLAVCMEGRTHIEFTEDLRRPGTKPYMALELLNKQSYTEKIDIWSFGVTVTEMVSGIKYFTDRTAAQAVWKIIRTKKIDFKPSQPLSAELDEFIGMCLEPDPDKRASCLQLLNSRFIAKYNHRRPGTTSSVTITEEP